MAYKRVKTEDIEINYKFSCRCCLKSEAEFFKLDTLIDCGQGENEASTTKLPLLRLLLYCMRTENIPELPQYICVECRKSLQISYYFIQNALRAQEILCRKLCPGQLKTKTRFNGQQLLPRLEGRADAMLVSQHGTKKPIKSTMRHECKICGAVIYNRLELRQHLRMHAESSRHQCKLCDFVTFKHRQLLEHYRNLHGLTATQIENQIKIRRSLQESGSTTRTPRATSANTSADDDQVTICTQEDMELLIPTVLTPGDFSHPQLNVDQLYDIEQQITGSIPIAKSSSLPLASTINVNGKSPNVSIGAEFLVMPDGSLQQVNDAGVVFEYIDDSKNASTTSNMTLQSLLSDSKTDLTYDAMDIDVSHMVVDNALPQITVKPKQRPAPHSSGALKHKCKLCPKVFPTVARLKSHQLTHSNLPKFYCDQCNYYSLRSADLIQHYTTEHNVCVSDFQANQLDASPTTMLTDRNRIFSCDMCLFETPSCGQLRLHYCDKHLIVPNEIQLRPSWVKERDCKSMTNSSKSVKQPDIPLGIKYPPMATQSEPATTMTTVTTDLTTRMEQQAQATTTTEVTADGINVVVNASSLFYATTAENETTNKTTSITTEATVTDSNISDLYHEPSFADSLTTTTAPTTITHESSSLPQCTAMHTTTTPNTSIFGDMQDFIDNTDVAAICTIPADDMPVVDGDDIVIDNNNISLDFDAEKLFEEFDVPEGAEGEDDEDEDEDDAENDDENDNNEAASDQNLLLTSDDDDVDDFDDEQPEHLQKPLCLLCNKKFTSQYRFENHMFLHRGLAPYRCELCTNLYNMKRLLIKHYKTVHKKMPTRDMVQAKGDKVSVPSTVVEKINVQPEKSPFFMCAKCPYECEQECEIRDHLISHHGINNGGPISVNDTFFYRKLPYECPRCIRSFAAKRMLIRHLQRSHLVDTINEMQAPQLTTSSATTTTTSTATALPNTASDGNITPINAGYIESNVDYGDEDDKCEEQTVEKNTGSETENSDTDMEIKAVTTTSTVTSATQNKNTQKSEAAATTSAGSTLFPTPTPFDFDLDFIGNDAHNTSLKNNNDDDFNDASLPSMLLNGSDKLLSVTLEPSPIKDLRSRLPRTPIYVCKQCNQTFDELGKLLQHELLQHSSGSASPRSNYDHQCKICNTSYRTVTLLNYHMKRHAADKIHSKQEPKESHPIVDLKRKSGNRLNVPLKCGMDGCKKTFNYKHHLKRHQTASHISVKYICPECGRDMLTSSSLRNHMSMHRGSHSYKCPKCLRTYLRKNPFRRHALREHKWELTDAEIDEIYCVNELSPAIKTRNVKL